MVSNGARETDPYRLSERLHTRRDIHAIAEDVMLLDDHIPKVDSDMKSDAILLGHRRLAAKHAALDLDRATHRIEDALELRQQPVARVLYGATPALLDRRFNEFPKMRFEPLVCPLLVLPHQARIARHVGGQDRGKAADRG